MGIVSLVAFILRAIFVLFVIRLGGIILRSFFGGLSEGLKGPAGGARTTGATWTTGASRNAASRAAGHIEELVKDPICGVHTARASAIVGKYRGESVFFCSPECAAKAVA